MYCRSFSIIYLQGPFIDIEKQSKQQWAVCEMYCQNGAYITENIHVYHIFVATIS